MSQQDNEVQEPIIRIRGLPWSATREEVMDFFQGVSIRNGSRGILMTLSKDGRPSGEAYLELDTMDDYHKALDYHKKNLGSRYIEVFPSKREEMNFAMSRSGGAPPDPDDEGTCVRLRGLPWECKEQDIELFFSGLEIARDGLVLTTDYAGRLTGEAFVKFATRDSAEQALGKNKEKIGHRWIEVFPSHLGEFRAAWSSKNGGGGGGGGPYRGGDGYDNGRPPYQPRNGGPMGFRGGPMMGPNRYDDQGPGFGRIRGHLGNGNRPSPYERFPPQRSPGGGGGYAGNGYNGNGGYRGESPYRGPPPATSRRLDYDGYTPHPRPSMPPAGPPAHNPYGIPNVRGDGPNLSSIPSYRTDMFDGARGREPTYGSPLPLSPQRPSRCHLIRMRGLPFRATVHDIEEFFHPLRPVHVELLIDGSGRPSGNADVEFATHQDAQQAMNKDKANMQHRYIELFLESQQSPGPIMAPVPQPVPPPPLGMPQPPMSSYEMNHPPALPRHISGYQSAPVPPPQPVPPPSQPTQLDPLMGSNMAQPPSMYGNPMPPLHGLGGPPRDPLY